jgi:NADH-quinone oxidoreductase subunit J
VSRVLIARGTVRSAPAMADDVPAIERQLSGHTNDQRDSTAHPSASSRDQEEQP